MHVAPPASTMHPRSLLAFLAAALPGLAALTAHAQDVKTTGVVYPSPATSPIWTVEGALNVGGLYDTGALEISGNGSVFCGYSVIGTSDFATGYGRVSGGGTWTISDMLNVGPASTGFLEIAGTGRVVSRVASVGGTANTPGDPGSSYPELVHVTVTNSGSWANSEAFYIGTNSRRVVATMVISGEGSVSSATSYIGTGIFSGMGRVRVTGGSFTNTGALYVGDFGNGTLEVSGSGSVTNTVGYIADSTISRSVAQVSGGTWTSSAELVVGQGGIGTLELSDTGSVVSPELRVGALSTATGTVSLLGGTLTTGQVSKGLGAGTVTFNGGTLLLTGNQSQLFSGFPSGNVTFAGAGGTIDTQAFTVTSSIPFGGDGALTKKGSGILTLSGANTYSGETRVLEGTLVLPTTLDQGLSPSSRVLLSGDLDLSNRAVTIAGLDSEGPLDSAGRLYSSGGDAGQLTIANGANEVSTFNGSMGVGGAHFALVKSGPGSLILTGPSSYTRGTTVNEGTLALSGSLPSFGDEQGSLTLNGGVADLGGLSRTVGAVTFAGGSVANGTLIGASYSAQSGSASASVTSTPSSRAAAAATRAAPNTGNFASSDCTTGP